jgi:hypothetical protein
MKKMHYNDIEFALQREDNGWRITRRLADGCAAVVAAGLFQELSEPLAEARAVALVRTIFPVGIRRVAPDVARPTTVGDIKIVGPDVAHPQFVGWSKDSTSLAK